MGFSQFANSVGRILRNRHINRARGLARHFQWQARKALGRFPFELRLSESRLTAAHRRCGVSALVNCMGLYDYNNMHLLKALLGRGGVFFDAGANIGTYTLIASEAPAADVWAFEPHPGTFRLLEANVKLNARANVHLVMAALTRADGTIRFTDDSGSAMNHIAPAGPQTIEVKAVRGDSFCREHGIKPDIMKIDVEGFEFDVLEGCGDVLDDVQVLMLEMNGLADQRSHGQHEIHRLLESRGFSGPWQGDWDGRRLTAPESATSQTAEDCLYVSAAGRAALTGIGFGLPP